MNYQSKFVEILGSYALFMETLSESDYDLYCQIQQESGLLEAEMGLHRSNPTSASSRAVGKHKAEVEALYAQAERAILRKSMEGDTDDFDKPASLVALEPAIRENYVLPIAICLRDGLANPVLIAEKTKLRIADVIVVISHPEFQAQLPAFLAQTGASLSQEVATLIDLREAVARIQLERAVSALTEAEMSDDEMISLGYSPLMRNIELSVVPGARSGMITLEPISINMDGPGGVRRITKFQPKFDNALFKARMDVSKRLTELDAQGQTEQQQSLRSYVRSVPEQIAKEITNDSN